LTQFAQRFTRQQLALRRHDPTTENSPSPTFNPLTESRGQVPGVGSFTPWRTVSVTKSAAPEAGSIHRPLARPPNTKALAIAAAQKALVPKRVTLEKGQLQLASLTGWLTKNY